jgi:hypothetical protein
MNCADFEKWLYDNPKDKELPADIAAHLEKCAKCGTLWKMETILLESPKEEEKLFFPPQIRAELIKSAKKAATGKYKLPNFLEDSVIQALIISILIAGGIFALPRFVSFDRLTVIKPFVEPVINTLNPLYLKIVSMFSITGGIYLFAFMIFAIVFSLEVYFKTILPKARYQMS